MLLDLGEHRVADLFKLVGDLRIARFELVDLVKCILALVSRLNYEGLCRTRPVVALNATVDNRVKDIQLVAKQVCLALVDQLHNVVVVTHNEHYGFAQNS